MIYPYDLVVTSENDVWKVVFKDGTKCAYFPKTFKREQDAKTALTKALNHSKRTNLTIRIMK